MNPVDEKYRKSFALGEKEALRVFAALAGEAESRFREPEKRLLHFGGLLAGMSASFIFHGHRYIETTLSELGERPDAADRWVQTVVDTVGRAMIEKKLPVRIRFVISRPG